MEFLMIAAFILLITGMLFCGWGKALGSLIIGVPAGMFIGFFVSPIVVDVFFPNSGPGGLALWFIGVLISGVIGYIVTLFFISLLPISPGEKHTRKLRQGKIKRRSEQSNSSNKLTST